MSPEFDYTTQQKIAIDLAINSVSDRRSLIRIGGYAGTGKTTLLREVYANCPNGAIVAFAGKACEVLRRKGLPGQTIHSLIYKWDQATRHFYLIPKVELGSIDWIGVDEGSMVGEALWTDLQSFKKPTLVIGDPGQLEPVADNDPRLMQCPDFVLEEIHRQALNNPIIKLSMEIRAGDEVNWSQFERPPNQIYDKDELLWPDMIITGKNKTRVALNKAVRKARGFSERQLLHVGERFVCRCNDKRLGVYNGQLFTVLKSHSSPNGDVSYDLVADGGNLYSELPVAKEGFHRLDRPSWDICRKYQGRCIIGDYGYAGTCHTSQGSEYDKVAYIDEQCGLWCPIRHRYTGVTRAALSLRVYKEKGNH